MKLIEINGKYVNAEQIKYIYCDDYSYGRGTTYWICLGKDFFLPIQKEDYDMLKEKYFNE